MLLCSILVKLKMNQQAKWGIPLLLQKTNTDFTILDGNGYMCLITYIRKGMLEMERDTHQQRSWHIGFRWEWGWVRFGYSCLDETWLPKWMTRWNMFAELNDALNSAWIEARPINWCWCHKYLEITHRSEGSYAPWKRLEYRKIFELRNQQLFASKITTKSFICYSLQVDQWT